MPGEATALRQAGSTLAVALPPLLGHLDPWRGTLCAPGVAVMGLGAILLLWCVRDFYVAGKGTLAPWDPPRRLVVVGLYRVSRNPMYVAVLTLVAGWAVLLASPLLAAYAVVLALAFHARVRLHEEPWLESTFGNDWRDYRSRVNRWLPTGRP